MLQGKYIAITGKLLFYKRKAAFEEILARGGIPQRSVTHHTDYLVVGIYPEGVLGGRKSNKLRTAERYNDEGMKIEIIDEDRFLYLLWNSPLVVVK